MDLKQMEYFKTIVDTGSISEAARKLHISQPPLSMSMKKLEEDLNTQLLIRGSRHVQLTDAGALFYQRVCRILELTRNTVADVAKTGEFRIFSLGLTPSTIPVASRILAEFSDLYPDVHFQIYDGSTFELMRLFDTGVINAAFLRTPLALGSFESVVLQTEPMFAAIPRNLANLDAKIKEGCSVSLRQLSAFPLSIYRRYKQLLTDTFESAGLSVNYFSICDDTRTVLFWSQNGKAVSIFPKSLLPSTRELSLYPIDSKELETSILFIYKKGSSSDLLNAFLQVLHQHLV